jgi:hypothetical protein
VGVALLPTLVLTLVLAEILRERFAVPRAVFGGLIVYAVVNTLVPGLALKLADDNDRYLYEDPDATRRESARPRRSCRRGAV